MEKTNGGLNTSKSSSRLSFLKEQAIKTVFFFTASLAVVVVTFILLFLLRDGYPIFVEVGIIPFLFGAYLGPDGGRALIWNLPAYCRDPSRHHRGNGLCCPAFHRLCNLRFGTRVPADQNMYSNQPLNCLQVFPPWCTGSSG